MRLSLQSPHVTPLQPTLSLDNRRIRRNLLAGIWFGIGVLTCFQSFYAYQSKTTPGSRIVYALLGGIIYSGVWLSFVPLMLYLVKRFPLVDNLRRSIPVHLVASLVIGGSSNLLVRLLMENTGVWDMKRLTLEQRFWQMFYRLDVDAMTYWGTVGLCQGVTWYLQNQESLQLQADLERRLTRAQLDALRMQINPHFLFNTLHTISSMITVDPVAADLMVVRLSEFLRLTLNREETQEAPLEEEIDFIERYLEIERIRFHDRMSVTYEVEPEASRLLVPRLILQPLVENAIRHGISRTDGQAAITISARRTARHLALSVTDTGPGVTKNGTSGGVGLRNTRERLERMYGHDQSFTLRYGRGKGTEAALLLPARESG